MDAKHAWNQYSQCFYCLTTINFQREPGMVTKILHHLKSTQNRYCTRAIFVDRQQPCYKSLSRVFAPLKLRPYGTVQISLLLLLNVGQYLENAFYLKGFRKYNDRKRA